jgi:hypothetical protein
MASRKPLDQKAFTKVNKKVLRFVKKTLPKKMLQEFIKNTPRGETGNASRRSNNSLKIRSNKFTITGNYPYSGVLDRGLFPNPPKEGTGKTTNGYSTQATSGMIDPTLKYGNKILAEYIKRVNR